MSFSQDLAARHTTDSILAWLMRVRPLRILTVGETILDEYAYCRAVGKSSKEPILAVNVTSAETFAGGILAVANHIAGFCDQVSTCSTLGALAPKRDVIDRASNKNVDARFIMQSDGPTIVKRRYIDQYFFQKLFEVYEMNDVLAAGDDDKVCDALRELVPAADLVVVVDFGHGMLSERAVAVLCDHARFLAVNAQSNAGNLGYHTIGRYRRADFVSLAEGEIRLETRDRHGPIETLVEQLHARYGYERVVVTRGKSGCLLWKKDAGFCAVPAFADKVVDRVGAGDAFLAITAPLAAVGAPLEVIGLVGNATGAEAVATVGNRTPVSPAALTARLRTILAAP